MLAYLCRYTHRVCLPPELEREVTVVEVSLPGKEELGLVLDGVLESATMASLAEKDREAALDAATGPTTTEAENAFALSVAEAKVILPTIIAREKAQAVKKNGLLEIIETKESLDSIGGLDVLKDWLLKRRNAFGKKARAYGLPVPKGLLIIGIPGTGKSLTAKATASVFGVPLLRLDAGRISQSWKTALNRKGIRMANAARLNANSDLPKSGLDNWSLNDLQLARFGYLHCFIGPTHMFPFVFAFACNRTGLNPISKLPT
jgi:ATPase family protein associated with various cellular activities (AAA)